MRKISADLIFDGRRLHRQGTLHLHEDGRIAELEWGTCAPDATHHAGLLMPGFVNAHCHLELSHLRGAIPEGTGMAGFIRQVQRLRGQHSEADILAASHAAAAELQAHGVCAVGDICNGTHSLAAKQAFPGIHFHNFIEVFGLDPGRAEEFLHQALRTLSDFAPMPASVTLHAPYSVSAALRDKVLRYAQVRAWPQSIHLMESAEERQLFEDLEGPLMDFLRDIGAPFQGHVYDSAQAFILEGLSPRHHTLLVHNTELSAEELATIAEAHPKTYFVLCPAANHYIHRTTPDPQRFLPYSDRVCVGTDSLASNSRLDILHELRLLQAAHPVPTETLLQWGSTNGAEALGLPATRHSIAPGSYPALIHLGGIDPEAPMLHDHITIAPLIP
jgi:cytosine/adenosine deaminase-related metal-dependent hydrolase